MKKEDFELEITPFQTRFYLTRFFMQYKTLGNAGLLDSRIGLGTMTFGHGQDQMANFVSNRCRNPFSCYINPFVASIRRNCWNISIDGF